MSTAKIREALERMQAIAMNMADIQALSEAEAELEVIEKAGAEAERVKATLRGMFDARALDPYPTSDASDEYVLRAWCDWHPGRED